MIKNSSGGVRDIKNSEWSKFGFHCVQDDVKGSGWTTLWLKYRK